MNIATESNFLKLKAQSGRTAYVACEDLRIKPRSEFIRKFSVGYFEACTDPSESVIAQNTVSATKNHGKESDDGRAFLLSSTMESLQADNLC